MISQKKKKKRRVLIFNNDWDSEDDSSDSDYEPNFEPVIKEVKRRKSVRKEPQNIKYFEDIDNVPVDIWVEVFHHCVKSEGALPFLIRASRVCKSWYQASQTITLWEKIDLSFGWVKSTDQTLEWLANNRLKNCRMLNLSGWKNLTSKGLLAVAMNCPLLEVLDISNTSKKVSEGFFALVKNCPKLMDINFSKSMALEKNHMPLEELLKHNSSILTHLKIGHITILPQKMHPVFNTMLLNCHNLTGLELDNIKCSRLVLNIEDMQKSLGKLTLLKILHCPLVFPKISQQEMAESPGFQNLEQLFLNIDNASHDTAHNILMRILRNAYKLEVLDLPNFGAVTPHTMSYIVSDKLSYLQLPVTLITEGVNFAKWALTLDTLNLSRTSPRDQVNSLLQNLLDTKCSEITRLDVSNTELSLKILKSILKNWKNLEHLNISQCRELPRGIKRIYIGKEVQSLREKILK